MAETAAPPEKPPAQAGGSPPEAGGSPPEPAPPESPARRWRRRGLIAAGLLAVVAAGAYYGTPLVRTALSTESTDDAYVNGHVTFVAPRVAGEVARVLVDDNYRVKAGDLLVELDKEPYRVQVDIAKAAVTAAEADIVTALAGARSTASQARSLRYKLDNAMNQVDAQVAALLSKQATLEANLATEKRAQGDFDRGELAAGGLSAEERDKRRESLKLATAAVRSAREDLIQTRVTLGLPAAAPDGKPLSDVPPDVNQTAPAVRQAQADLIQAAASLGLPLAPAAATPKAYLDSIYNLDPDRNIDRLIAGLVEKAPAVVQYRTKLQQAKANLAQADLNLRYCDIRAEIDGVVTRRNVNTGNYVAVAQQLMAVQSLTEVWVDCNFKETQLADLAIGQRVDVYADMYGKRLFKGRVTGFTYGTGSTLALLPAQNATGNFVKVVQRLPVRVELEDYNPDDVPLLAGLSMTPYVFIKEPPVGPNAGKKLQEIGKRDGPLAGGPSAK